MRGNGSGIAAAQAEIPAQARDAPCSEAGLKTGDLVDQAAALAPHLPDGGPLFNLCKQRPWALRGFIAAMMSGRITLLPQNTSQAGLKDIVRNVQDVGALLDRDRAVPVPSVNVARLELSDCNHGDLNLDPDALVAIGLTSGSTGQPKRCPKRWGDLVWTMQQNARRIEITGEHTIMATVPSQHMYGLEFTAVMPLALPCNVSPAHPLYPQDLADALEAIPAPRVLVTTPVHLRSFVESGLRFAPCDRIVSATAPLERSLAQASEALFQGQLVEVFGSTETCCFASRRTALEDAWWLYDQLELRETRAGAWQISGPPYRDGPVPLGDLFDITDRRFEVIGRCADMVEIAGKRASLADLNTRLLKIDGVIDGVIFEPEDASRLAGLAVAPGQVAESIRNRLRQTMDAAFVPRPLLLVDSLPRNATGKLPRESLLEAYQRARKS